MPVALTVTSLVSVRVPVGPAALSFQQPWNVKFETCCTCTGPVGFEFEEPVEDGPCVIDPVDDGTSEALNEYTFKRFGPPQYSLAFPLQVMEQPFWFGSLPPGATTEP